MAGTSPNAGIDTRSPTAEDWTAKIMCLLAGKEIHRERLVCYRKSAKVHGWRTLRQ